MSDLNGPQGPNGGPRRVGEVSSEVTSSREPETKETDHAPASSQRDSIELSARFFTAEAIQLAKQILGISDDASLYDMLEGVRDNQLSAAERVITASAEFSDHPRRDPVLAAIKVEQRRRSKLAR